MIIIPPALPATPAVVTPVPADKRVVAESLAVVGDVAVNIGASGDTRIIVGVERGIFDPGDAVIRPRRVSAVDPAYYVVSNMYQSIANAIAGMTQSGGRVHGEVIIPPGKHQLANTLSYPTAYNLVIRGSGQHGDEVGLNATDGGYGTTTLISPTAGGAAIQMINPSSLVFAGPRIEDLTIIAGNTGGKGIAISGYNNIVMRGITCYGFNAAGGHGIHLYGGSQYGSLQNIRIGKCMTGILLDNATATMVDLHLSGNHNGNDAIVVGSVGYYEKNGGGGTSFGMKVQGFEALFVGANVGASYHSGVRLEDFSGWGIVIDGGGADGGFQLDAASLNNHLGITRGYTTDRAIQVNDPGRDRKSVV